jgi:hypothetical protein
MKIYLILLVLFFASQSGLAQVVEPVITIRVTDGKFAVSGTVWNQSFKEAVTQRIEMAYGKEAKIDLTINPQIIRYEDDWL